LIAVLKKKTNMSRLSPSAETHRSTKPLSKSIKGGQLQALHARANGYGCGYLDVIVVTRILG
jgi:hypothetical protein